MDQQMALHEEIRIIEKLLSSDVKADLLVLFNENPRLTDDSAHVARTVGRTLRQIDNDLRDLIDIGLLFKKNIRGSERICYDRKRAKEIQKLIADQIKAKLD